jgi:signal transduction histidine kinase
LTIVVCTFIAGALIYRSGKVHQLKNQANDYHVVTRLDISRIEYELNALKHEFHKAFSLSQTDDASGIDRREVGRSISIIDRHAKSIFATQQGFADASFDKPVQWLTTAIGDLNEVAAIPSHQPPIIERVFRKMNLVQTRCIQLDRLHTIAFRKKESEAHNRSTRISFVTWMSILLGIGCLSILSVLGFARRAIKHREKAENTLAHRAMQAELLHKAVSMANQAGSIQESLRNCLETVCAMTDWPVGHAYLPSQLDPPRLESTDIWHLSDQVRFAKLREVTERTSLALGEGLPGRIWESGAPEWVADIEKDDSCARFTPAANLSVKATFGIPVRVEGNTIAILEFFSERRMEQDRTMMLIVATVGDQVGLVIERKMADDRLREMGANLAHFSRLQTMGEMVAGIAHEVNQPLAAIANFTLASKTTIEVSDYQYDVPIAEWMGRANEQAVRCGDIIRSLRNFVKKGDAELEWVDLNGVITETIALIGSDLPNRSVVPTCRFSNSGPRVHAIRVQLQQVLVNLLRNACDATRDQTKPEIVVEVEFDEACAQLTVSDNGPGIEESQRLRLFEPFFTTKPDGMGMGLAISMTIIEAHGGSIRYERAESSGAKFVIRLPAVAAAKESEQIVA